MFFPREMHICCVETSGFNFAVYAGDSYSPPEAVALHQSALLYVPLPTVDVHRRMADYHSHPQGHIKCFLLHWTLSIPISTVAPLQKACHCFMTISLVFSNAGPASGVVAVSSPSCRPYGIWTKLCSVYCHIYCVSRELLRGQCHQTNCRNQFLTIPAT